MTIHNTLSSTPYSSLAKTAATEKASSSSASGAAAKSQPAAALEQPTPPAAGTGLVGHLVNTTA
ncbi:hypothetical protein EVC45_16110 [Paraburkholderia sp. UYCP14C]|uniref:hypothetical protein n=1 Tax=Paraburkholderia sp. UYCP14C TaxID=2511130 RepID=UPI00101EA18C|nr:hypothetical protein [Paraburkholderia sp. UYCP14C]RZF28705.1 hypothetical protein EVC45_16110 [Paraburkholderia sp. UYCP14C]